MSDKIQKFPNPDHPITITPNPKRVVVRLGGQIIADSVGALTLHESHYTAVQYIPRKDVDMNALTRSEKSTYCPYKGDASYFGLPGAPDAVWTYEHPYDAVHAIKEHVAFYPDRVDSIEEQTL